MKKSKLSNILVTGTPGTGKSTLCEALSKTLKDWKFINLNEFAKEKNYYDGYDEELQCHILDEDRILDDLEEVMSKGHVILDYHYSDLFPERWFSLVIVLRAENQVLAKRYQSRSYCEKKKMENFSSEILNCSIDQARDSYSHDIVHELRNETENELVQNIEKITRLANKLS